MKQIIKNNVLNEKGELETDNIIEYDFISKGLIILTIIYYIVLVGYVILCFFVPKCRVIHLCDLPLAFAIPLIVYAFLWCVIHICNTIIFCHSYNKKSKVSSELDDKVIDFIDKKIKENHNDNKSK